MRWRGDLAQIRHPKAQCLRSRAACRHPAAGDAFAGPPPQPRSNTMNQIIYIIGLIVVVMAVLAFLGLR